MWCRKIGDDAGDPFVMLLIGFFDGTDLIYAEFVYGTLIEKECNYYNDTYNYNDRYY